MANRLEALSEFLGISLAQLEASQHAPGATWAGVAALYGKSRDQLKAFLIEQNLAALEEGVIEQEDVERLKEAFDGSVDAMIDAIRRPSFAP